MYSCIILEDEELPRLSLKAKLETYHPEIEIMDMCDNCDSALESVLRNKPDILFCDIELPEKNSLWLLEKLEEISSFMPAIIFTTAFNDSAYLLKAIKHAAVDYLLKPVNIEELARAIKKVKERLATQHQMTENDETHLQYKFKTLNSVLLVHAYDIAYFVADGNYTELYLTNNTKEMVFERLGEIETKVKDSCMLTRVGRSWIINKKYIYKIDSKNNMCSLLTPHNFKINISVSGGAIDELIKELGRLRMK